MDIKKDKVVCIILMNMVSAGLGKIIDNELDKGDKANCSQIDLFVEVNEMLAVACEQLGKDVI